MYRRRRLIAAVLVCLLAVTAVTAGEALLQAFAPEAPGLHPSPPAIRSSSSSASRAAVTVRSGDTLWSIARRLAPGGDVRAVVDRLASIHGTGPLRVGERLPVTAATGG